MKQQSFRDLLKRNPGVLVSVGYLVISLIGMLFSQALFSEFGVNYFNYAEVSDFLLAALREPMTFALAGGAVIVVTAIFALTHLENKWLTKRSPRTRLGKLYQRASSRTYNNTAVIVGAFFLYSYSFLNLYGDRKSEQIKSGIGKRVTVELATESDARHLDNIMLLGTSNKFVFVYDVAAKRVEIIPNENISRLIVKVPEDTSVPAPEPKPDKAGSDAESDPAADPS